MDQGVIKDALKNTLDTLDTFFKWFLSVAVIIWWAGLSSNTQIKILDLEIDRSRSFAVIGVFFIVMNVVFFLYLKRLHFLIITTGEENKTFLFTNLFTHPWILNPFGVYNAQKRNKFSCFNISFLTIMWWLCNGSLYALYPPFYLSNKSDLSWFIYCFIFLLFLLIGYLSLKEIFNLFSTVKSITQALDNESIKNQFDFLFKQHKAMLNIGVAAGFLIASLIIVYSWYSSHEKDCYFTNKSVEIIKDKTFDINQNTNHIPLEQYIVIDSSAKNNVIANTSSETSRITQKLNDLNKRLFRLFYFNLLADTTINVVINNDTSSEINSTVYAAELLSVSTTSLISILSMNQKYFLSQNLNTFLGSANKINPLLLSAASAGLTVSGGASINFKRGNNSIADENAKKKAAYNININAGSKVYEKLYWVLALDDNGELINLKNKAKKDFHDYATTKEHVKNDYAILKDNYYIDNLYLVRMITSKDTLIIKLIENKISNFPSSYALNEDRDDKIVRTEKAIIEATCLLEKKRKYLISNKDKFIDKNLLQRIDKVLQFELSALKPLGVKAKC